MLTPTIPNARIDGSSPGQQVAISLRPAEAMLYDIFSAAAGELGVGQRKRRSRHDGIAVTPSAGGSA